MRIVESSISSWLLLLSIALLTLASFLVHVHIPRHHVTVFNHGHCQSVLSLLQCLHKAMAEVKPGVRFREIGNFVSQHAQQQG